jgi:hypothetical protein
MIPDPHAVENQDEKESTRNQDEGEDHEDLRELRSEREESRDTPSRGVREIGKDLGWE